MIIYWINFFLTLQLLWVSFFPLILYLFIFIFDLYSPFTILLLSKSLIFWGDNLALFIISFILVKLLFFNIFCFILFLSMLSKVLSFTLQFGFLLDLTLSFSLTLILHFWFLLISLLLCFRINWFLLLLFELFPKFNNVDIWLLLLKLLLL